MAETGKKFECPFEGQGKKENRLLRIPLSENRDERLQQLRDGFAEFHKDKRQLGLIFTLPNELLARCASNLELKHKILPYQTEAVAADLDLRLHPFWPYQLVRFDKNAIRNRLRMRLGKDETNILIVQELCLMMAAKGRFPCSSADIADWLESEHLIARDQVGGLNSMIRVSLTDINGKRHPMLNITPHTAIFETDRDHPTDPVKNRNCFGIVRSPFYPESFGRYSPNIEMVYTREADFTHLPEAVRRKITSDSNRMIQEEGIPIGDLETDKQGGGVWAHEVEPSYANGPLDGYVILKE